MSGAAKVKTIFFYLFRLTTMGLNRINGERILQLCVWIGRCKYSRGFGVQSPWAYHFIRYVINEHYPYYAYEILGEKYPSFRGIYKKLLLLYFRISNYRQLAKWGFAIRSYHASADYVRAGCKGVEVVKIDGFEGLSLVPQCDVLVMELDMDWQKIFDHFAEHAQPQSILIVKGIYSSKKARSAWKCIQQDARCGVTFDLYYCGIVFFNKTMYKQHYMVNF